MQMLVLVSQFERLFQLSAPSDRRWFSTVGMTARPENGTSVYLGMSVRGLCGDISFESWDLRISRRRRVEAVVHLLRNQCYSIPTS